VVLPCPDLDPTVAFFTGTLGFRVDAVFPADDPVVIEISGHGLHIRLERGLETSPGVLRVPIGPGAADRAAREVSAPNGTRVLLVPADPPVDAPSGRPSFVLTRMTEGPAWHIGRAGMEYRDLIPDRQGGRFIASHIRIPDGGPVPDYVHFHKVRFQMIFCYRGWVRVVYEDQGPPFVLEAGDCVLQPPEIRHRVLEASPGLEVIEVSCPAEHETRVDHDLVLPTAKVEPGRDFHGQRFVRHVAATAGWSDGRTAGFEARDLGLAAATGGLAGGRVVRPRDAGASSRTTEHGGELFFLFVLGGELRLRPEGSSEERLAAGDAVVVPAGMRYSLGDCSSDLEWLELRLPS
jgi:quercetin dioxygenase-like cupin family protein